VLSKVDKVTPRERLLPFIDEMAELQVRAIQIQGHTQAPEDAVQNRDRRPSRAYARQLLADVLDPDVHPFLHFSEQALEIVHIHIRPSRECRHARP